MNNKDKRTLIISICVTKWKVLFVFLCLQHDLIFRASGPTIETDNRQSTKDDFISVASLASLIIANIISI